MHSCATVNNILEVAEVGSRWPVQLATFFHAQARLVMPITTFGLIRSPLTPFFWRRMPVYKVGSPILL